MVLKFTPHLFPLKIHLLIFYTCVKKKFMQYTCNTRGKLAKFYTILKFYAMCYHMEHTKQTINYARESKWICTNVHVPIVSVKIQGVYYDYGIWNQKTDTLHMLYW